MPFTPNNIFTKYWQATTMLSSDVPIFLPFRNRTERRSSFCRTKTCVKWKLEPCHKYTLQSLISFSLWIEMERREKSAEANRKERMNVDIFAHWIMCDGIENKQQHTGSILAHNYFLTLNNRTSFEPFLWRSQNAFRLKLKAIDLCTQMK